MRDAQLENQQQDFILTRKHEFVSYFFSYTTKKKTVTPKHTTSRIPWAAKRWTSTGISPSLGTKSVLTYRLGYTKIYASISDNV